MTRLLFLLLELVLICMSSLVVFAAKPTGQNIAKKPKSESDLTSFEISLGFYNYGQSSVEVNHVDSGMRYRLKGRSKRDVSFKYSLGVIGTGEPESTPTPLLENAYYFNPLRKIKIGVSSGLKKIEWSHFDSLVKWGQWNPKVNINGLRPEEQGVFGLFIENFKSPWKFKVGFTPLFIPDLGPQFKIKDGEMLSGNRWFHNPIGAVYINDIETPVEYKLGEIDYAEMVQNYGLWLQFGYQSKNGFFTQLSLAHKPMNQLIVQVEKPLIVTSEDSGSSIPVTIHPTVLMHNLATYETGYSYSGKEVLYSITYDQPLLDKVKNGYQQQDLYVELTQSILLKSDLKWMGLPKTSIYTGGWIRERALIPNPSLGSADSKYQIDIDVDRFPEGESYLLGLNHRYKIWGYQGDIAFNYVFAKAEKGQSIIFDLSQRVTKQLSFQLEGDVLSSTQESESKNFYNRFRNNDRIYGGIRYVF